MRGAFAPRAEGPGGHPLAVSAGRNACDGRLAEARRTGEVYTEIGRKLRAISRTGEGGAVDWRAGRTCGAGSGQTGSCTELSLSSPEPAADRPLARSASGDASAATPPCGFCSTPMVAARDGRGADRVGGGADAGRGEGRGTNHPRQRQLRQLDLVIRGHGGLGPERSPLPLRGDDSAEQPELELDDSPR